MFERVVLDVAGLVAQLVELGQLVARVLALVDEAGLDVAHGALQLRVGQRRAGVGFEGG